MILNLILLISFTQLIQWSYFETVLSYLHTHDIHWYVYLWGVWFEIKNNINNDGNIGISTSDTFCSFLWGSIFEPDGSREDTLTFNLSDFKLPIVFVKSDCWQVNIYFHVGKQNIENMIEEESELVCRLRT